MEVGRFFTFFKFTPYRNFSSKNTPQYWQDKKFCLMTTLFAKAKTELIKWMICKSFDQFLKKRRFFLSFFSCKCVRETGFTCLKPIPTSFTWLWFRRIQEYWEKLTMNWPIKDISDFHGMASDIEFTARFEQIVSKWENRSLLNLAVAILYKNVTMVFDISPSF